MRKIFVIAALIIIALLWMRSGRQEPRQSAVKTPRPAPKPVATPKLEAPDVLPPPEESVTASEAGEPQVVKSRDKKREKPVLPYKIRNGLMIVQGDLVAGAPTRPDVPDSGFVIMQPVKLWAGGNIPFYVQPSVGNPERVLQAIAMFDGTAVHLTPYKGEDEVLVFEPGDKDCLSYVGKMGGKQPVWISPDCQPADIAHEILHALGFVHEQNRTDRDNYIDVLFDNIDDRYADNFEKLPQEFMNVSGLGEFDFHSLMIYPQWMFAKNGQSTMEPKLRDKLIQPGSRLSAGDIDRINKAYGH